MVEFTNAHHMYQNRNFNFISVNFLVLRADPDGSRKGQESPVPACEENGTLRSRNMKEQGLIMKQKKFLLQ